MGIVFLGLISLVFITKLIGFLFRGDKGGPAGAKAVPDLAQPESAGGGDPVTAAIITAVLSAMGEDMGNMRITKIQKL